jgi:hypothetical protein
MPGLVPGIHDLLALKEDVDGRAKDSQRISGAELAENYKHF